MANPYKDRPDYTYWSDAVSEKIHVDPVVNARFQISETDKIATAGSCFAQHISRTLLDSGFAYLVTENYPSTSATPDENYGVFPARFGNVYTARQLVQLFDRAYGAFAPTDTAWTDNRGYLVDPFRPRIQKAGFPDIESLNKDRIDHLRAVREMFEKCDVFIFTLGLTESWVSKKDGAAYPLCPMAVSDRVDPEHYEFHNFSVTEVVGDMTSFIERFRSVNNRARIMLTVSPVSLIATYEDRHVLTSTIASKSILRAAVEDIVRAYREVAYFPSYEIITGPQSGGRFFESDMREVNSDGVSYVMSLFRKHYMVSRHADKPVELSSDDEQRMRELAGIVCDEETIFL